MDLGGIFASLMNVIGSPYHVLLLLIAVPAGIFFGAIPGLGGKLGIVLAIPFVFGMAPLAGAIFLISMHSVVHTGGAIPSILFGVPGTGPDAATIVAVGRRTETTLPEERSIVLHHLPVVDEATRRQDDAVQQPSKIIPLSGVFFKRCPNCQQRRYFTNIQQRQQRKQQRNSQPGKYAKGNCRPGNAKINFYRKEILQHTRQNRLDKNTQAGANQRTNQAH